MSLEKNKTIEDFMQALKNLTPINPKYSYAIKIVVDVNDLNEEELKEYEGTLNTYTYTSDFNIEFTFSPKFKKVDGELKRISNKCNIKIPIEDFSDYIFTQFEFFIKNLCELNKDITSVCSINFSYNIKKGKNEKEIDEDDEIDGNKKLDKKLEEDKKFTFAKKIIVDHIDDIDEFEDEFKDEESDEESDEEK